MSQNDLVIDNQSFPATRADINSALQAIGSLSSGPTAPTTTYANMLWYDTGANILKMRSEADDAWINVGTLDQSANTFQANYTPPFTPVQQGGGIGQLTNKVYIGWNGSGLKVTVDSTDLGTVAFGASSPSIGESQTWAVVSRTAGTSYQNTTGRSIQLLVELLLYNDGGAEGGTNYQTILQVSSNGSTWVSLADSSRVSPVIPSNHYYRYVSGLNNTTGNANFAILS